MVQAQTTTCIHRWVLSAPGARTVRGVCRRCGASRVYPSGLELPVSIAPYEELDRSLPLPSGSVSLGGQHVA